MRFPISSRRRKSQHGIEAIEFGLLFVFLLPPFVWMFTNGMNFLRFNKSTDVSRSAALMYVKGLNFSFPGTQNIIARVASGLDLQVSASTTANGVGTGSGLIVFSTVQYIGPNTCNGCANLNKYVFLNRVYVGNTSLSISGSTVASALGNPNSSVWNSTTGAVSSSQTNTGAQVAPSFSSVWSTPVGDGQIAYVIECFFKPQGGFGTGSFDSNGVYTRVIM
jgi:hypothetical protein